MPCSCDNVPVNDRKKTSLDAKTDPHRASILLGSLCLENKTKNFPLNSTQKYIAKIRLGNEVFNGYILYSVYSNNDKLSFTHNIQTIIESNNPKIAIKPITGIGFLNLFEYKSFQNGIHLYHELSNNNIHITNTSNNIPNEQDYHITGIPSNSYCCYAGCGPSNEGYACCPLGNSSAACHTGVCWCCCEE